MTDLPGPSVVLVPCWQPPGGRWPVPPVEEPGTLAAPYGYGLAADRYITVVHLVGAPWPPVVWRFDPARGSEVAVQPWTSAVCGRYLERPAGPPRRDWLESLCGECEQRAQ